MGTPIWLGVVAVLIAAMPRIGTRPGNLPAIVFVSRQPIPGEAIPGVGPHHRSVAPGGRLMVREPNGRGRDLVPTGMFHDVSDPDVSWDGKRIVFAATTAPDSAWRIWTVNADGTGAAAVTRTDRALDAQLSEAGRQRFRRYDDLDPCWLPDGRICFASTRFPQRAQFVDVPVTNLFVISAEGNGLARITSERNGGEEPSIDPVSGRIVYTRWLFNRFLASDLDPHGVTLERARAVPQDSINLWQAVSVLPDGDGVRLAGGDARAHRDLVAYEPRILADGSLVAVDAAIASLSPGPGVVCLRYFEKAFATPKTLTGAGTRFPGPAVAPLPLPDGRLLFSGDPEGCGDFGLFAMRIDAGIPVRILDLPGTHELDAAVLASRRLPPVLVAGCDIPAPDMPLVHATQLADSNYAFRFDCLNVFANGPVDSPFPDAPPLGEGLRIRFFGVLSRPESAGGDTLVLAHEAPVTPSGAVHVDAIRADTPMFEQLVDAQGRVVRAVRGPAHVPGYNFSRFGSGTKCVGCHTGHSALDVARNYLSGKWFNAAPSADVWVSSSRAGGERSLVDRRARGPADEVGWVADSTEDAVVRLSWKSLIEIRALVLYSLGSKSMLRTPARWRKTEVRFLRGNRELQRLTVEDTLSPSGTRLECAPICVDAVEIRPLRLSASLRQGPSVGLAEIETIARLYEEGPAEPDRRPRGGSQ